MASVSMSKVYCQVVLVPLRVVRAGGVFRDLGARARGYLNLSEFCADFFATCADQAERVEDGERKEGSACSLHGADTSGAQRGGALDVRS